MRTISTLLIITLLCLPACNEESGGDILPDGSTPDARPKPGPLKVGVATLRIPAPLGIGTAGFLGLPHAADSPSPFASLYPGTDTIHGHPELRAAVISRGPGNEVVFLRVDAVGVFQQLRRAVVLELKKRLGRDMDHALLFGGTHTHSGPGRVINGGPVFDLIADTFFPEYYLRLVKAAADVVEAAYKAADTGRVGHVITVAKGGQKDRRCDDGKTYTNETLPLLFLERKGKVVGVVFSYAVHGTVLGIEEFHLSRDVSGAIEEAVEDAFDHPVQATYFNAWAADIAPGEAKGVTTRTGATQYKGYDSMEKVGQVVGKAVRDARSKVTWESTPEITMRTHRFKIDREAIGYTGQTFPYEYGGVYCAKKAEEDCDPKTKIKDLDKVCVPFNEKYPAPNQSVMTQGRVGSLHLLTFPGEPGTLLAEKVIAGFKKARTASAVMFLGYTQDYLGYSILEEDWWQGGYEASGALWGPKQGEYLVAQTLRFASLSGSDPKAPAPIKAFEIPKYTKYTPATPLKQGQVLTKVKASYKQTDSVVFAVAGGDPWLGAPLATLQTAAGAAVKRKGGLPVTSDGYAFQVKLAPEPSYKKDIKAKSRTFTWTFTMPVRHKVPGGMPELKGKYRLSVALPTSTSKVTVTSAVFTVE